MIKASVYLLAVLTLTTCAHKPTTPTLAIGSKPHTAPAQRIQVIGGLGRGRVGGGLLNRTVWAPNTLPITVRVSKSTTKQSRRVLSKAIQVINTVIGIEIFKEAVLVPGTDFLKPNMTGQGAVMVSFPDFISPLWAGETRIRFDRRTGYIKTALVTVAIQGTERKTLNVTIHELLHSIGVAHHPSPDNIMYATANPKPDATPVITQHQIREIQKAYRGNKRP